MLELVGGVSLIVVLWMYFLASRYKRCSVDKILVVSGKTGSGNMAEFYTSGGAFVWPVIQDFAYLDRKPLKVRAEVKGSLEEDGVTLGISGVFVVAIGETKSLMVAAANRLLTLKEDQIIDLCEEVIKGQLRLVVGALASVEISDQKQLVDAIYVGVNEQLNSIGLQLLNVDLNQIQFNKGLPANQAQRISTEGLGTKSSTVELELRSDQVDALLRGETINLQIPDGGRTVLLSTSRTTN